MIFTVRYSTLLDPKSLATFLAKDLYKIKLRIEQKLITDPALFGKPLRRSLRGYWSLRVNDYRVVYRIQRSEVLIFVIDHRSIVYETASRMI